MMLNPERYQNLCVYLDDVIEMCTPSDRQSLKYIVHNILFPILADFGEKK